MKKIVILAAMLLSATLVINAQEVTRNGKNFTQVKATKTQFTDTVTGYTYTIDKVEYPMYISKNGHCYIWKTSQRTGNKYKSYMSEEVSRAVCAELKREYIETKKKNTEK